MKHNYKKKKTSAEARIYRNNLGDNEHNLPDTYINKNSMLIGSGEVETDEDVQAVSSSEAIAKKSIDLRIFDWIKKNIIAVVVIPISISFGGWALSSIIDIKEKVAVYQYRIEALEDDISEIKDNTPNKEVIELRIDALKNEIERMNITDIEDKLADIEKDIENIKAENHINK